MSLVNEWAPRTARLLGGSFQHCPKNVHMNIIPTRFSLPKEFCGQRSLGNVDYVACLQWFVIEVNLAKSRSFHSKETCLMLFYKDQLNLFDIQFFLIQLSPLKAYFVKLCPLPCQVSAKTNTIHEFCRVPYIQNSHQGHLMFPPQVFVYCWETVRE